MLQAGQPDTSTQKKEPIHHTIVSFFDGHEKYNIL